MRRAGGGSGGGSIAAAVVLAAAGTAAAQDDGGPVVVSPRPDLEPFGIYDFKGALELEWRRNYDSVDPTGGPTTTDTADRLREILELRTGGFVGHPNLLELDLGGRFWFEQRWLDFDTSGTQEFTNQFLLDWDISGLFIKETKFPLTLYTRQNISEIDRQFGGTLQNTFQENGLRLNFRDQVFPTNLQFFQRRIKQVDFVSGQGFTIDQYTAALDGRVELGLDQRLAWDLKYDDVNQSGELFIPNDFRRLEGNATHTFEFGERKQNTLRTRLRIFNETGGRDFTQVRLLPRLSLEHSSTLNSWYDYSFEYNNRPQQEQFDNRATANVQYRVFDSMNVIGTSGFNLLDIPTQSFDSNEIFGRGEVQYNKEVPGGELNAGLNGIVSFIDQSDRGSPIQITNQAFTFNAFNMFTINLRNVQTSSIVITDLTGLITYTVNVDYFVMGFPDSVEVTRIAGGGIAPGETVLVDYLIGPEPGGTTVITGAGVDLRYTFEEGILKGLSPYVRVFRQDETRSVMTADFPENDFTDLRYGVEYNIWKLYFKAEGQDRSSTLSPFEAFRFEGRYVEPLGRGSSIIIGALYQVIDREQEFVRTKTATFTGQWNQRFNDNLRLQLTLQYQMTNDTVALDSNNFEGRFDIWWQYRQMEIYGQFRTSINDTTSDDTIFSRFVVGIRREF